MNEKKRLLLHSCCGPCSTTALERLTPEYFVTVFYYNPNIYPAEEYLKRKREQLRFISEAYGAAVSVLDCDYESEKFFEAASGYESCEEGGERCARCFRLRLARTAREAASGGFDLFCTTLTVSPHKNAALINSIGEELAAEYKVGYLQSNFKKQDGYLRSITLSKQYGIYRQHYCGCIYSLPPHNNTLDL